MAGSGAHRGDDVIGCLPGKGAGTGDPDASSPNERVAGGRTTYRCAIGRATDGRSAYIDNYPDGLANPDSDASAGHCDRCCHSASGSDGRFH